WQTYAMDHGESCVRITSRNGADVAPSWVLGNAQKDSAQSNIQSGLLFAHVTSLGSYVCPADKSFTKAGNPAPRVRSYSISAFLNHDYVGKSGAWDPSVHPGILVKTSALAVPSEMFVFIEDHTDSIDDGAFETSPDAADQTWMELPSDRHNQAENF